jgi:hypothetical protein
LRYTIQTARILVIDILNHGALFEAGGSQALCQGTSAASMWYRRILFSVRERAAQPEQRVRLSQ